MSRTERPSSRTIPRREFIRGSAAVLTGISALASSAAFGRKQKVAPHTDYSPVIERIEQTLPVAMSQRDITGASIALVDGESIVWSKGFGYTNRAQKEKVTGDTLFHVGSISKSFTALGVSLEKGYLYLNDELRLAETGSDFFITADGEAIIFSDERLSVGNKLYSKKK